MCTTELGKDLLIDAAIEGSGKPSRKSNSLQVLQENLSKGLSTGTLKRQVATLNSVPGAGNRDSFSNYPYIRRFLPVVVVSY